ncbi:MAG: hypothetical protein ACI9R3_004945 [Verrucomicrobiales bacterium]|jgi:hypothetical protein
MSLNAPAILRLKIGRRSLKAQRGESGELTLAMRKSEHTALFYRSRELPADAILPVVYEMELEAKSDGTELLIETVLISTDTGNTFLRKRENAGFYLLSENASCLINFDPEGSITGITLTGGSTIAVRSSESGQIVTVSNPSGRVIGEYTLLSIRSARGEQDTAAMTTPEILSETLLLLENLMAVGFTGDAEDWHSATESAIDLIQSFGEVLGSSARSSLGKLGFTPALAGSMIGSGSSERYPELEVMDAMGNNVMQVARTMEEAMQIDGPFVYRPECLDLRFQVNAILGNLNVLITEIQTPLLYDGNRHWFNGSYQAALQEMLESSLLFLQMYEDAEAETGDYCVGDAEAFILVMGEIETFLSGQQTLIESYRIPNVALFENAVRARDAALAIGQFAAAEQMETTMEVSRANVLEINTAIFTISGYRESFAELQRTGEMFAESP